MSLGWFNDLEFVQFLLKYPCHFHSDDHVIIFSAVRNEVYFTLTQVKESVSESDGVNEAYEENS